MALFTSPQLFLNGYIGLPTIIGLVAGQYVLWIYPLLMWLFLYYVTGIPFSEKQAIKSRGQNYLDYQQKHQCLFRENPKIGAHMDFIVHQSLKLLKVV